MGAQNVIDAAIEAEVKKVIALSTDKAANPVNLYGATKLVLDKSFVAANNIAGAKGTRFSVVRYGNVVGSRGSVVPVFKQKLQEGCNKLPVTHSDMTRFWITLNQGVEFVVRNFQRMQGGEIFVPKIPSIHILDLVEALTGNREHEIIGIRPGEKLHEVMVPEEVSHQTVEFDDHYVITPSITFFEKSINYTSNLLGETGKFVQEKFEYHSGTNPDFLSIEQIRALES
jgi:UDP-N-acetylglucosamine 4,6-dehydratase